MLTQPVLFFVLVSKGHSILGKNDLNARKTTRTTASDICYCYYYDFALIIRRAYTRPLPGYAPPSVDKKPGSIYWYRFRATLALAAALRASGDCVRRILPGVQH